MNKLTALKISILFPALFLLSLIDGLVGCSNNSSKQVWFGYTVGDFIYVASPFGGRLEKLAVLPGEKVSVGAPLFDLDSENESAIRSENLAKFENAMSTTNNLSKGKREDEIKVIEAQLAQAEASRNYAIATLKRDRQTFEFGGLSKAELDIAITNEEQAVKRVDELRASLSVARLPSRRDEILASQANAAAAKNALKQSDWQLAQKHQNSKVDGMVYEVFFRIGEYVSPAQPVLSILPPKNIKVRFFVPESDLTSIQLGHIIKINCDGCSKDISAKVSRIATQAEYTPPVIYSNSEKSKLMFLIEAYPAPEDAISLRPGQPIEVIRFVTNTQGKTN